MFQERYFALPSHYEETPLCDRKENLPNLYRDDQKAEFIRDVIPLANSARSFGRPARLLFGIDDKGRSVDLGDYLLPYEAQINAEVQLPEKIRSEIGKAIFNHVAPELSKFEFELGQYEGKRVAYLLIHPLTPSQRFHVSRALTSGKRILLHSGQCWIRFGEHREAVKWKEISRDDKEEPYWYSYAEIPYILPSSWLMYFSTLQTDEAIAKAQTIVGYQEPRSATGQPMKIEVQRFLESEKHLLVIEGLAGVGKTAFLRRWLASLAESNTVALKEVLRRQEYQGPSEWIPLLLPLRGFNVRDPDQLTKRILDVIHKSQALWKGKRPLHPEHLLEYSGLRWLICLDGLDEIWSEQHQRHFLGALGQFLYRFRQVKVVVTTRPEAVGIDKEWLETTTVQMEPFSREMVLDFVANHINDEAAREYFEEVKSVLSSNGDLWRLCSFPVCLEAAMKELADVYPEPLPDGVVSRRTRSAPMASVTDVDDNPMAVQSSENASRLPQPIQANDLSLVDPLVEPDEQSGLDEVDEQRPQSPIRVEIVLHGIYSRLRQREIDRGAVKRQQAEGWWENAGKLALRLDGHHKHCDFATARTDLGSERALNWLLSLGVLDRLSQMSALVYRTEMTKTYLAAIYMLPRSTSQLDKAAYRLYRHASPDFQQQICNILSVISTTDLSSLSQQGD